MNDLKFAFRQLLKNPGFTAVAVLTLALGIGANTAIFSVTNAVLLRPLPYRDSGQLVWVYRENLALGYNRIVVTPGRFWNLKERNTCFSQMASLQPRDFILVGEGKPQLLRGLCVSPNLTEVLGVTPVLGRGFRPEEADDGNHRVALLSYGIWQSRFGGDPSVIGKPIRSDTDTFTIVGILPRHLHFPLGTLAGAATTLKEPADIWTPGVWTADQKAGKDGDGAAHVLARLKPGKTVQQADAEVRIINRQWDNDPTRTDWTVRAETLEEQIAGPVRPLLLLLLAAVGLVLLIACVNVANLFLVRGSARHKEMAVRVALGASRFQILRQLWTESLLFSVTGGGCGVLLAFWGIRLLIVLLPADLPRLNETQIDPAVLGFAGALSIVVGFLFGSAPAVQATHAGLNETLKDSSRGLTASLRSHRLRNSLVVAEIALSLILLSGAGLLIRSFLQLNRVNPGFDSGHILAVNLTFSPMRYPEPAGREAREAFTRQLIERIEALPEVRSAAACMGTPLAGGRVFSNRPFLLEGEPIPPRGSEQFVRWRGVSPGYFRTMGIPLVKGRDFTDRDKPTAAAIVSESFVRKFCGGREPIGLKCNLGEIIGVVGDCRDLSLKEPVEPRLYLPAYDFPTQSILVRSTDDPRALAASIESTVLGLDKDQPVQSIQPLEEIRSESISQRRSQTLLLGLLATAALVLAAVGIYGVMASLVVERTHEIGVRMALGAQVRDVFQLVLQKGMRLALIGAVAGLAGALGLTRMLRSLLFEVSPADPLALAVGTLLVVLTAPLACWAPARRAARIDPMEALRHE